MEFLHGKILKFGLRYAQASLRPAAPTAPASRESTTEKEDILSRVNKGTFLKSFDSLVVGSGYWQAG